MSKTFDFQLTLNQKEKIKYVAQHQDEVAVQEVVEIAPPPIYKVIMLNDDFTPMDFVVEVLEHFFGMPREQAIQVMLTVHREGKANCGEYSKDVAETKVDQVIRYAREHDHPLLCEVEKV